MAQVDWKQRYFINTFSSYLNTGIRMICGLLLFRLLFSTWDEVELGFWFFMWSLFGYAIFLDFGLGVAVQKVVAQRASKDKPDEINHLLATVFWSFAGIGIALAVVGWFAGDFIIAQADVPGTYGPEFIRAYRYFVLGLGVMLPLGLLPSVLDGLQRMDIANILRSLNTLGHFVITWYGLSHDWAFSSIVLIAIVAGFLPNVLCGVFAGRLLKGLSLAPKYFDPAAVKKNLGFSLSSYLITCSNLIITQSDRLIIGFCLGAKMVTPYMGGFKVAEMLMLISVQMLRVITPAAANLSRHGDKSDLQDLFLRAARMSFILLTPLYLLCVAYLEPLIRLLTDYETIPVETLRVGQFLLLAIYFSEITASCARRILLMGEGEKRLLIISTGHAVFNVVLSIILVVFKQGIVGVALATLIGNILFSLLIFFSMLSHYLELKSAVAIRYMVGKALVPLLVFAAILIPLLIFLPIGKEGAFFALVWRGALVMIPTLACAYPTIRGTWR